MNIRQQAEQLLAEFNTCITARPRSNAAEVQLEKDTVSHWAVYLNRQLAWGSDIEVAEACHQLAPRLDSLKKKLVFEILKHGSV